MTNQQVDIPVSAPLRLRRGEARTVSGSPPRVRAGQSRGTTLDYARTFSIGFGMLAISAAWALYNAYVPIKLKDLAFPTAAVGLIMGIDNLCGLTIQPLFGILSDSVRTRWGRRIPFALFVAPVCAIALVCIAAAPGAAATVLAVSVYAILMAMWRAPIIALMPDVTPSPLRSKANGIINLMGSIGSVLALGGGSILYRSYGITAAFGAGAIIMVLAIVSLVCMVHEPKAYTTPDGNIQLPIATWDRFRDAVVPKLRLDASARRSFRLIMVVLFSYSLGGNAIETYFTLYATHDLHMQASSAGLAMTFCAGGAILFAVIAGIIGQHLGRRLTMSIGLICGTLAFIPMPWIGQARLVIPLAAMFGVVWTLVIVNALPWITELGGMERTGTMTAYYYLATAGGAAISPVIFGVLQQWTGEYRWMFLYAAVFFAIAVACMPFIKHGEAPKQA